MKAKEIKDLLDYIATSGMDEVNIETEEFKISVKKNAPVQVQASPQPAAPQAPAQIPQPAAAPASEAAAAPAAPDSSDNTEYVEIKSPMIGTLYMAPNPQTDNYVKVGDKVKKGDTVCIVEAMKLFNEIESEVSGTIVKIIAEDASPVEFDQPLFLVQPD